MKRFLLFYGAHYYPRGGWNDFGGSFDSAEDAIAHLKSIPQFSGPAHDWAHIVDTQLTHVVDTQLIESDDMVWEFGGGGY